MKKSGWIYLTALSAFLGLGLGESAWALSLNQPDFAWPEWSRSGFWLAGAALGMAWAWGQGLAWKLGFFLNLETGLKAGAASLLPGLLAGLRPLVLRFPLPYPHHLPLDKIELLLAAQGLLALSLACLLGLRRLWPRDNSAGRPPFSAALRLGALSFAVYFLTGAWTGHTHLTGDAPHYLLISHSLVHDRDVDLAGNYAQGDYLRFYDRRLFPQEPAQADGRQVSEHKPLLPVLLAPGYLLFGLAGARWVLALLAALGCGVFYLLCLKLGFSGRLGLLGWALFSFSAPWWVQSQVFLTELPGGLLFLAALACWQGVLPRNSDFAACGLMAWLNVHFYPAAGVMLLMSAWQRRKAGWGAWLLPVLGVGLSFALSLGYNQWLFGSLNPQAAYQQRGLDWLAILQPQYLLSHASGLFLDQEFGWFPFVPVTALAFYGARSLWHRDRELLAQVLIPTLAHFGLVASFFGWRSDMAPNRYLICLAPGLALLTLEAWRQWGGRPAFWILGLASWGWGIVMAVVPWFCWSKTNGSNRLLQILGKPLGLDPTPWFPSFVVDRPLSYAWVAAFLAALWLGGRGLGLPRNRGVAS